MTNDEWYDYLFDKKPYNVFPYRSTQIFYNGRPHSYFSKNFRWSNTWADIFIVAKEVLNRTDK